MADYNSGSVRERIYSGMRGVDFSGDGSVVSPERFSYLENMYRDYDGEGAALTESMPGFRVLANSGAKIHGIYPIGSESAEGGGYLAVHAGSSLYVLDASDPDGGIGEPLLTALADERGCAFGIGDSLCLISGGKIYRTDGTHAARLTDADMYIPLTYVDGQEYEQGNLLGLRERNRFTVSSASSYLYGSEGLSYRVTDEAAGEAALSGIGNCTDSEIYVPPTAVISGRTYRVTSVDSLALSNCAAESVCFSEGLVRTGSSVLSDCPNLKSVRFPESFEEPGTALLYNCGLLEEVYFGSALKYISTMMLSACPSLTRVCYSGSAEAFAEIPDSYRISSETLEANCRDRHGKFLFPLSTPAATLFSVTSDGVDIYSSCEAVIRDGLIRAVTLEYEDAGEFSGAVIEMNFARPVTSGSGAGGKSAFSDAHPDFSGGGQAAILGCTVSAVFDDRVFLSGNPDLPNTVFYSQRELGGAPSPVYFGIYNFMDDGISASPVTGMISLSDELLVLKRDAESGAACYFHSPVETGDGVVPKIYPASTVKSGVGCLGAATGFLDDTVFLCRDGLAALTRVTLSSEKNVTIRSHNVNPRLLSEDLSGAMAAVWRGYLTLFFPSGRVYMADSRQTFRHSSGSTEYEWYYLTGIGTCKDDTTVWRACSAPPDASGYVPPEDPDAAFTGDVFAEYREDGTVIYFVRTEYGKVAVYRTSERTGGEFSPPSAVCSFGGKLFFGTESGDVCIFNTDKRGEAPEAVRTSQDFDAEKWREQNGRRIPAEYYSYAGHAPEYALVTALDDCGIPHITKRTVRRSSVIKCASLSPARIHVGVRSDGGDWSEVLTLPLSSVCFGETDFSALGITTSLSASVPFGEPRGPFTEKQISVTSSDFCAPIGIYSIAYRYKVAGRIKIK